MPESSPPIPQLYARYCIPLTVDRYELRQPVIPLPSTALATTTPATTLDVTNTDHDQILTSGVVPPHLKLFYMPKIVKNGTSYRICQFRYCEEKSEWVWMSLAQPLSYPDLTRVRPRLRIPCPSLEQKFDLEEVLDFLRTYNIRENGSYYKAAVGDDSTARGYGPKGTSAPSKACK